MNIIQRYLNKKENKNLLFTELNINKPTNPIVGAMYYDLCFQQIYVFNGSDWIVLCER
jgi:hypothetical protein